MKNVIKLAVYASVGLYDKMREEVDELVKRGELKRRDADDLIETVEAREHGRVRELSEKIEKKVKRAVDRLPPNSGKRQIEQIEARLDDLHTRVQRLEVADLAEAEDLNPV